MSTDVAPVDYSDLLKDIQQFYDETTVSVFCPVANIKLKFKPLTVKQLKTFIELQVATEKDGFGVIQDIDTVKYINQLIMDNCVDFEEKLFYQLTPMDRDAIVLQLRANVKNKAEVAMGEGETQDIDLNDIVEKLKTVKFSAKDKTREHTTKFSSGTLTVNLRLPSIVVDGVVNEHFRGKIEPKLKKGKKHIEKEVETILSDVYFLEISKYIGDITVDKGKTKSSISFDDQQTIQKSLDFLESLPSSVIAQVSEYVGTIKEYRDSVFSYTDSEGKEVPLNVDISLFTGI